MDNDTAVRYTKCKGGEAMREKKDINIEIGGNIQVAREQDVYKRQVHKVALFILRSRENSVHSVEKLTGQHTPYTFPIITE